MHTTSTMLLVSILTVSLLAACLSTDAQTLYQTGKLADELYSDLTARKVGDTVTVVILQNARANQSAQNAKDRSASLEASADIPVPTGLFSRVPEGTGSINFSGRAQRSGTRTTTRQTSFVANVTATVEEVLENGNLRISGSQHITIGDEETEIRVSGIIRRFDIQPDNSVLSSAIADARIEYQDRNVEEEPSTFVKVVTFPFRLVGSVLKTLF